MWCLIVVWVVYVGFVNVVGLLVFDVCDMLWLVVVFDVIVCINMIYILLWVCIDVLFVGVLCVLWLGGVLFLYGLYCCEGWYMVLLNEVFD